MKTLTGNGGHNHTGMPSELTPCDTVTMSWNSVHKMVRMMAVIEDENGRCLDRGSMIVMRRSGC